MSSLKTKKGNNTAHISTLNWSTSRMFFHPEFMQFYHCNRPIIFLFCSVLESQARFLTFQIVLYKLLANTQQVCYKLPSNEIWHQAIWITPYYILKIPFHEAYKRITWCRFCWLAWVVPFTTFCKLNEQRIFHNWSLYNLCNAHYICYRIEVKIISFSKTRTLFRSDVI